MRSLAIFGLLAVSLMAGTVEADWHEFWARVHIGARRNNCWPQPFSYGAREAVRQPQMMMINAGWRQENTIPDALFNSETNKLTQAGILKVREIVTQYPMARRQIYVLQGGTPELTAIRLDTVQQAVAASSGQGPMPPVVVTNIRPAQGAGSYYNNIHSAYNSSIPAPRLSAGGGGE